ncbi:hypothetical protein PSACC_02445, partial [Paramicrosporidium saccamoebae]
MSIVNILNIQVLDNPTRFTNPFQFEITFECTSALQDGTLQHYSERFRLGMEGGVCGQCGRRTIRPDPRLHHGRTRSRGCQQADAPNPSLIPATDITGVTVVLITCGYRGQEFVRVGYYVNNEYEEEELRAEPPAVPVIGKLLRNILADKPRVTRFPIRWDGCDELEAPKGEAGMLDGEELDEDNESEMEVEDAISASPEHQSIQLSAPPKLSNPFPEAQ